MVAHPNGLSLDAAPEGSANSTVMVELKTTTSSTLHLPPLPRL